METGRKANRAPTSSARPVGSTGNKPPVAQVRCPGRQAANAASTPRSRTNICQGLAGSCPKQPQSSSPAQTFNAAATARPEKRTNDSTRVNRGATPNTNQSPSNNSTSTNITEVHRKARTPVKERNGLVSKKWALSRAAAKSSAPTPILVAVQPRDRHGRSTAATTS